MSNSKKQKNFVDSNKVTMKNKDNEETEINFIVNQKLSEVEIAELLSKRSTHTVIANEGNVGFTEETKKNLSTKDILDELSKDHDRQILWGEKKQVGSLEGLQGIDPYKTIEKAARPDHPIPLQDRVLITKTKPEEKVGLLYIPEIAIKDNKTGIVVAVGPLVGSKTDQHTCPGIGFIPHPGDLVLFGEYAGTEIEYKDKKYLIMRESDILCILP